MDQSTKDILFSSAIKVLKSIPERFKRERIYQTMEGIIDTDQLRSMFNDTDDNRDTKDSKD